MKGENIFKLCLLLFIIGLTFVGLTKVFGEKGYTKVGVGKKSIEVSPEGGYTYSIEKFEDVNGEKFLKRIWVKVTPPDSSEDIYLYSYAVPYIREFLTSSIIGPGDDVDDDDIFHGSGQEVEGINQFEPVIKKDEVDTASKAEDYVSWDDYYPDLGGEGLGGSMNLF